MNYPIAIEAHQPEQLRQAEAGSLVGVDLQEQYLRDLATLERIEQQIVEQGGIPADLDFFSAMGEIARRRADA